MGLWGRMAVGAILVMLVLPWAIEHGQRLGDVERLEGELAALRRRISDVDANANEALKRTMDLDDRLSKAMDYTRAISALLDSAVKWVKDHESRLDDIERR